VHSKRIVVPFGEMVCAHMPADIGDQRRNPESPEVR
jgi:hypothetical protein